MRITKKNLILSISVLIFLTGVFWIFRIYSIYKSIDNLKSDEWQVREQATKNLGKMGKVAIKPLIGALKSDKEEIRWKSAKVLGNIKDSRAVEPLIKALEDKDRRVRYRAIQALGEIGDIRAIQPLISVLKKEKDIDFQRAVVCVLMEIDQSKGQIFIDELKRTNDNDMRSEFIKILGEVYNETGNAHIIEALIDVELNDEYCCVLNKAIRILDWISWGCKDKNEKIMQLVNERGWDICIKIGEPALKPLIDTLEDGDKDAQQRISEILAKMTGEDFGPDFYRWRMWWKQKEERTKYKRVQPRPCKDCR